MALKISLKPGEKFVVNGAVLTNGDKRSAFVIQNKVSILRERDIITEEQANTPAKRVYFAVMLSYLDSERAQSYYQTFVERMSDFMNAIENQEMKLICVQISMDMMKGEYYRALTGCRKIVEYESKVLGVLQNDVAASLS